MLVQASNTQKHHDSGEDKETLPEQTNLELKVQPPVILLQRFRCSVTAWISSKRRGRSRAWSTVERT